ncbi:Ig-like domain-containing protein [Arthrobacter sp. BF1]|uniref:Ig-like domain-containing protein n=1 Tax=Arthrobacter sp. BF1 TaxID=2821145 RepID=UPI001C4F874A|nr:Ig-like domain-containing protein [Arthrobacter sp. BF1]
MALSDLFPGNASKKQFFTASAAIAVAAVVVTGAVVYPGFTTADVDLNDGSVWVTNRADGLVGHLNDQSKVLDGGFAATSTTFDVTQDAGNVFVKGDGGSLLSPVNVHLMAMASETGLGGGKQISQGTSIVSLTDSGGGKVWAMDNSAVPAFSEKTSPPILKGLRSAVSVTAPDDTIFTVDAEAGELITTTLDGAGKVAAQDRAPVEGLAGSKDVQLTVAGGKAVAFSPESGTLFLPGGKSTTIPEATGAVLAQPTADGNFVAVETSTALFTAPLDGSAVKVLELGTTGKAVAPVVQNGCVHAAWSGANKYALSCNGAGDLVDIPKASAKSEFVFRKNRDVVVLNDVNTGNVWLVNQNMLLVNNWDDLKTDLKKADNADKESADPNVVSTLPDRTKPNRPPEAAPDSFGVRAGRTTILPVLFNDSDPDGDVLTVGEPDVEPSLGAVTSIYDGTGLQITVPNEQTGSGRFQYAVNDGRDGTAKGTVDVRVVPESENTAPRTMRNTTLVVEQGQTMKQNVLTDWIDPDGDDIFLNSAVSDDESAVIKTTPDGELSYTDDGEKLGMKTMTVSVSDGRDITEKQLKVNVLPAGGVPPVANADFVRAVAGKPVVLAPLKNDQDPSGGQLRLASVSRLATAKVSEIADNGTVTFSSDTVGAVYLEYQVTNGPMSATGLIRVEVVEADLQGLPVAVKDLVMLPSGGSALVDVLGNDSDPAGGVLVIQSVELPAGSPVAASIIDRNIIKLTDLRGLKDTLGIKYTISNGAGSATGEISVVRIPAPDKQRAPRVEPDKAIVRVGDVVSIPVLANDTDPNGEVLKAPEVVEAPDGEFGKLFTDQNQLRFIAGPTPKTVQGVYKVTNSSGQFNSAPVTITIVAADPEHNLPPVPQNLTGRVIAGDQVRIPVPLNAIDPEGDSVELVGIDKGPALGTAETGNGYIFYTAGGSSAGTDTFSYRVRDRLGAEAVARVDVGVAPPLEVNHPPVTEDDYITMRPGRKVSLDVMLNDSDPDGGQLGLVKNGFKGPEEMQPSVTDKGKVLVTSPAAPGIATMMYTVADKFGATATGNIRMTVTPDAPLKAPISRDDRVTIKQMLGKNTVDVPVLENDADPDGVTDDLKVSIQAVEGIKTENASVTGSGAVRVVLAAGEQMIPYTVTDQDGLKSTAVIWVPGQDKQYPVLKSNKVIRLTAGKSATMKLADYVQVREGRKPRLTEASKISLVGAGSENVIVGEGEGVNYAANISFYGPGSITFEVTDGKGPDDPQGLKSTLTVMTLVDPAPSGSKDEKKEEKKNTPPTFTGSSLEVPQQEKVTLDVGPLAFDIDPGDKEKFKYALSGNKPGNFDVDFSGTVLTVTQRDGTKVGETASVQVSVSDGSNEPVTADVVLRATSSSLPLPVANDDVVADAHAGRAETVEVLNNDVNPFPDTALRVVDTMTETGSAGVTVTHTDGAVTVNSDEDYKGTVVVRYVVEDKTKDAARHATGRIKITIKGRPDAPAKPQVLEEQDEAVLLTWDPPADNGAPITKYTVAWAGGSQDCATNTCTISKLKNAQKYRFTVTATNDVATSTASPQSTEAIPDRKPDAPAAPTTKFGDKAVTVDWVTPAGEFSTVTKFNVEISPAPAGQNAQQTGLTGNSFTWPGLENGTEYQFRVQAINNAPKPSDWGPYSASVVPAGVPAAPNAPTVQVLEQVGSQNQISVQWNEPFINGAAIKSYTLTQSGGGDGVKTYTPTTNSQTVTVGTSTSPYTFTVTATNKAGTGAASAASTPQRAVGKVATMATPSIAIANQNAAGGQVTVGYTPLNEAQRNGYAANEVTYCVTLSTSAEQCGVASGAVLASPNGAGVFATVRARAAAGGQTSVGDASPASATVVPHGVPGSAKVSGSDGAQDSQNVSYSWSYPSGAVDARSIEVKVGTGGWTAKSGNGSDTHNTGGFSTSVTIKVRAKNSIGQYGAVDSVTLKSGAKTPPPPPPKITEVIVEAGTWHSCTQGPGEGDNFYSSGGSLYCDGTRSPGGDVNLGGKWLDRADGWVQVSGCARSGWYTMSDGPHPGRWVKANTVDVRDRNGGNIRC